MMQKPPYRHRMFPMLTLMMMVMVMMLLSQSLTSAFAFGVDHVHYNWRYSALFSEKPSSSTPKRQPRRNLQKRRKRSGTSDAEEVNKFPWDAAESRPLVASRSKEMGEDYWIDPNELEMEQVRKLQNRTIVVGQVPTEKLWTEVLAPYQQNWIGICTMIVVMLATIVIKFPELLNPPVIEIPDI